MKDATIRAATTAAAKEGNQPLLFPRVLTLRESLYVSGNRKRDNLAAKTRDPRPRSRLYGR